MYKVSVVGIDNCGKTSVVRSLDKVDGVDTIHVTSYQRNGSHIARVSGEMVARFAKFGERNGFKSMTGLAYLLHLFPYYFEERAKSSSPVLVSDRDPIIDTICYSDFYSPFGLPVAARKSLKSLLEFSFTYPSKFCYLSVSPEESARRNDKPSQMHDDVGNLRRLRELFDEQMHAAERQGVKVVRIDTDLKPLEEVASEVRFHVGRV